MDPDLDPDPALFVIGFKKGKQKINFFSKFLCLFLSAGTFTSVFKDKKSLIRNITVEIKVFLNFFGC